MSAEIIPHPAMRGGIVYVVEDLGAEDWSVYSQAADAHEPTFEIGLEDRGDAVAAARRLAKARNARLLVGSASDAGGSP